MKLQMKKITGMAAALFLCMQWSLPPIALEEGLHRPGAAVAYAAQPVQIVINGQKLVNILPPYKLNGIVMVPARAILESLGASVMWENTTRTATVIRGSIRIVLKQGSCTAYVNNKPYTLINAPDIRSGSLFIPVRFVSESLGAAVGWNNDTQTVSINLADNVQGGSEFTIKGVAIGQTESQVAALLGQPARKDASEYGFQWYVYSRDYQNFAMIGIQSGKVVGVYTNTRGWKSRKGVQLGTARSDVNRWYGSPLQYIQKGNTQYAIANRKEADVYDMGSYYTTVFYDLNDSSKVTAVLLIEKNTELALKGYYGTASDALRTGFERQVLDLANAIRVRNGKPAFAWSNTAAQAARVHSQDMAKRSFFDHENPDGKSPFDRMQAAGIRYSLAGENIAAGQSNAIMAHEGWMNSPGHRANILNQYTYLGVGVAFGGPYSMYYTQNFYTPR